MKVFVAGANGARRKTAGLTAYRPWLRCRRDDTLAENPSDALRALGAVTGRRRRTSTAPPSSKPSRAPRLRS